jgi:hypothetical protein
MRFLLFSITALAVQSAAALNFEFFGINESGPEFGEKEWPGIKGKHVRLSNSIHSLAGLTVISTCGQI